MGVSTEELARLMYDTYETAAVKHGWKSATDSSLSWAFVPQENRAAMRDSVAAVEKAIREDERAKNKDTETIQSDLLEIMRALGLNTHTRSYSSHEVVQKEILPKIRKMKKTLVDVRTAFSRNFVEVKEILDEGRTL